MLPLSSKIPLQVITGVVEGGQTVVVVAAAAVVGEDVREGSATLSHK
jgi:hypothetical protein